jgi:hypothetical protein
MSFEEKKALSEAISHLSQDKLPKVLEIIASRRNNIQQAGDAEVEIDFEKLDAVTLRLLERYVRQIQTPKKKNPKLGFLQTHHQMVGTGNNNNNTGNAMFTPNTGATIESLTNLQQGNNNKPPQQNTNTLMVDTMVSVDKKGAVGSETESSDTDSSDGEGQQRQHHHHHHHHNNHRQQQQDQQQTEGAGSSSGDVKKGRGSPSIV